jgi:hypothetical protein
LSIVAPQNLVSKQRLTPPFGGQLIQKISIFFEYPHDSHSKKT